MIGLLQQVGCREVARLLCRHIKISMPATLCQVLPALNQCVIFILVVALLQFLETLYLFFGQRATLVSLSD